MLTHDEIRHVADDVLSAALGEAFQGATTRDVVDPDDEAALEVTARFRSGAPRLGGNRLSLALAELHARLLAAGEARFPYLRLDFADDEDTALPAEDFQD